MLALLFTLILVPQDGELDRIQLRFQQRREKVRTEGEFRRLLADSRLELETFLRDNPRHKDAPRAAFQIAETYLSAQDSDRAAEKLRAYLKDYPGGADAASARFAMAEIQLDKENDAEARASFEEFAKLHPGDERAIFAKMYVAITLQNEKRYDEASALLRSTREEYRARRESWGAMMQLAVLYHVQEKNAEAKRTLEEIIRDCPDKEPVEVARRHLAEYLKVGKDAPGFSEKDLDGRDASIDKLRGKVAVVYFFDPGLTTAMSEAVFLRKAREDAAKGGRPDDLQIIGISIGTERRDVGIYKAEARADWNLIFDGRGIDGKFARLYDVRSLPALTVVDRKGKIRFYNIAGRDFRTGVAKLLEEK
jgi:outer membrane protein assembly factor BamD (BamD/ComL family)